MSEFSGRRVLVTGSTRGIGNALARHFAVNGATVAVHGRRAETVDKAIGELGDAAAHCGAHGDLTRASGCASVVEQALDGLGGIDILINNAGVFPIATVEETDEATWDEAMAANVKSAFFTIRAALPALRASRGVVINHASIAGLIGLANVSAYCASKGAVVNLTRALAMELAPDVRVNCVCPTTVDNDMGWKGFRRSDDPEAAYASFAAAAKLKRLATEADVVEAFAFLASPRATFMTGVALPVDGGKSAGS